MGADFVSGVSVDFGVRPLYRRLDISGDNEDLANEIVVTAMRQARYSEHVYLANDGGSGGNDFMSNVWRGIDNATYNTGVAYDNLLAAIADRIADDDGDGTMNFLDKLHGFDDGVPQSQLGNGETIAEVRPGVFGWFDSSGDKYSGYFEKTNVRVANGSFTNTFEGTRNGGSVTVGSENDIFFDLTPIPTPSGLPM